MNKNTLTLEDLGVQIPWQIKAKRRWNAFLIQLRFKKKGKRPIPHVSTGEPWNDETLGIRRNIVTQESTSPGVRAEPKTTIFYG